MSANGELFTEVFSEEADFRPTENEAPLQPSVTARLRRFVGAVALTTAVIVIATDVPAAQAAGHYRESFSPDGNGNLSASQAHSLRLADRFLRATVPLSPLERLPDPDYGF